jgi:hypothetical protein
MTETLFNRRTLLKGALLGAAAVPAVGAVFDVLAADAPHLDEKDPQAVALGYVHDAAKVDPKANPTYKPSQHCANCVQFTGKATDAWGPCNIFAGKQVNAKGWCKVWVQKT